MRKRFCHILFSILILSGQTGVRAQYYDTGTDPATIRWNQIKGRHQAKLVFPDYMTSYAKIVNGYLDTVRTVIDHGLIMGKQRAFPVVLHTTNVLSNGMVVWAPRRMELGTLPPASTYAQPWIKQLAAHESRHVAQLNAINGKTANALYYLLGEQIFGVISLEVPGYFFEGDAVVAETQMAMFGRGLQPGFSIDYRAMVQDEGKFNMPMYRLGAINRNIPSVYHLGYQVTQYAGMKYGEAFWGDIMNYIARRPYTILGGNFALHKYGRTSSGKLIRETFAYLKDYWRESSSVPNSAALIPTPITSFTTYTNPNPFGDTLLVAMKSDLDRTNRLVVANRFTGAEMILRYTGYVTSRPILEGNTLYWTELIPSSFWGQRSYSAARSMKLSEHNGTLHAGKIRNYRVRAGKGRLDARFFITPIGGGEIAMIGYNPTSVPYLLITDTLFREKRRFEVPGTGVSFNGLAWDAESRTLAGIINDNAGMWLCRFDLSDGSISRITDPSYITLNNLSAAGGKLYFNSIASGKDEAHLYDLRAGKEYRISASKYGSFAPVPVDGEEVAMTTYTREGYRLSRQSAADSLLSEVTPSVLPANILNVPYPSWNLPKLDTIDITASETAGTEARRYRKAGHFFHVHSWMPFYMDAGKLMSERAFTGGAGVALLSQNLLSTMVSTVGYGWVNRANLISGQVQYTGLPVHFSLRVEYGGGKQLAYNFDRNYYAGKWKNYLNLSGVISMPVNLTRGNAYRYLTPYLSYQFENSLVYDAERHIMETGVNKFQYGINYQHTVAKAAKDLEPRLGYYIALATIANHVEKDFGALGYLLVRGYLPSFMPHHAIVIGAAFQYQGSDKYGFKQKPLYPLGCYYDFAAKRTFAASIDYKFPIAYPNWGSTNFLYFQRIAARLFGQYAHVDPFYISLKSDNPYTYGGELLLDYNIFGITNLISTGISVYKPSDKAKPMVGVSFGVAF